MLVVGSHGHRGMTKVLFGSVSLRLHPTRQLPGGGDTAPLGRTPRCARRKRHPLEQLS